MVYVATVCAAAGFGLGWARRARLDYMPPAITVAEPAARGHRTDRVEVKAD
jgi:hypothetical protein